LADRVLTAIGHADVDGAVVGDAAVGCETHCLFSHSFLVCRAPSGDPVR
jgi:hypothetical protein